ncbi:MAG: gamma-glutamylcyclotransferase [Cyanobacteria bacterium P01_F01_bin.56]
MERLFVYGTLQPGGPNEHVLSAIGGEWIPAVIKGRLIEAGWGAGMGYPGLVIDDSGDEIKGYVFISPSLSNHWPDLDEFEGQEYERISTLVTLPNQDRVKAYIYVLRDYPNLK